jgi:hypothetical protein
MAGSTITVERPSGRELTSLELQPTKPIELPTKMESEPLWDIEAGDSEYAPIDGNMLTEVSKGCPGHIIGYVALVVPLPYGRKRRKEHIHIEESTKNP